MRIGIRRKIAFAFVPILVVALGLTGCSSSKDEAATKEIAKKELTVTLSFMVAEYSPTTKPFWEKQVASFEKANPGVKVTLEVIGWQNMHDTTAQRIAAGTMPDLVNTATIWLPEWADAGGIQVLTDEMISPELVADMVPALLEKGAGYKDQRWGLPIAAAARLMYYNTDLFAQAGITAAPTTWSELETAAKAIKAKTGKFGYAFDAKGVQAFRYFGFFLWNNGGDFFDGDGKAAFNSQQGVEALEFLTNLSKTNAVPDPTGTALEDFQPLFKTGRLGMMIDGNFFAAAIAKDAPKLKYAVAPVPTRTGAEPPITWGVTDTLVVGKNAKPELVKAFLDHIYKPEARTEFDTNEGLLPVLRSQASDPKFADENSKQWMASLDTARFDPLNPNYSKMQELLKTAIQQSLKGKKSSKKALDDAAAAFNKLIG